MGVAFKLFLLALPLAAFGVLVDDVFEHNRQVILRDEKSAAHVMVSASPEAPMQRLVVALPPMNSAAAVQFIRDGSNGSEEPFTATMKGDPETYDEDGFHGVKVDIEFSHSVLFNNTVVGSARTVRDYIEGGILFWTEDEDTSANYFSYVFTPSDCVGGSSCGMEDGVGFRRLDIKRKFFTSPDEVHVRVEAPEHVVMKVTGAGLPNGTYNVTASVTDGPDEPFTLTFRADTNIPALVGIEADQIFNNQYSYLLESEMERAQQLSFLSWTSGWVAGSWRFNTYFGRDTLLTLAMMQDKVQWSIQEAVLAAALDRVLTDGTEGLRGAVCHEDILGDFAQWNGGAEPFRRNWACDYKMVDSDYLLLPVLARAARMYRTEVVTLLGRVSPLANRTYRVLLSWNIGHVVQSTVAFGTNSVYRNLIPIRHETVGNWRDSNEGLGWGVYPFDVNAVFVPAALRGILELYELGILYASGTGIPVPDLRILLETWEEQALALFRVGYESEHFELNRAGLDAAVQGYAQEGPGMLGLDISSTLQRSEEKDLPEEYFFAVALRWDGEPVPVLNTDIGFLLFFRDNLSAKDVKECARAASVPFPRGLRTDVGVVVANPAYAYGHYNDDGLVPEYGQTVTEALGRRGYHGTVVWSWQQALLLQGLTKYYRQQDPETQQELNTALDLVWKAVVNAESRQNAEMWGFGLEGGAYTIVDFGELTGGTTEGNIIQLWSYAFMGMARDDRDKTTTTSAPTTSNTANTTTRSSATTTRSSATTTTASGTGTGTGTTTTTTTTTSSGSDTTTTTTTTSSGSDTTTTTTTTTQNTDSAAAFSIAGVLLSFIVAFF